MHTLHLKYTLVATAAIALLTSCADGSSTPPIPLAFPQKSHAGRHATSSCPCLYATNYSASSVSVYAFGATGSAKPIQVITGNVAPIQTIQGSNTGLDHPIGTALDPVTGDIYVANTSNDTVTAYPPGAKATSHRSRRSEAEPPE